jgi:parvulin-like peptidyl-prolyl isomerase
MVRENVANGVRLDTLLGQVYAPEPVPTDAEVRAYYDGHLNEFMTEEMIDVSHITKGMEGAKSRAEVYTKMRELRDQLVKGADFAKLAEEQRGNEQQQIDLGWFKRGEFMEEFETIAFSMNDGEISPVFTTQLGYHICKLNGRKPSAPAPFDDIKDFVRARMSETYRDGKFNAFIEELKVEAKIEDTEPCEEDCGCAH